jgi:hypothetical protein
MRGFVEMNAYMFWVVFLCFFWTKKVVQVSYNLLEFFVGGQLIALVRWA